MSVVVIFIAKLIEITYHSVCQLDNGVFENGVDNIGIFGGCVINKSLVTAVNSFSYSGDKIHFVFILCEKFFYAVGKIIKVS